MAANKATVSVSASVLPDDMKVSVGGTIIYDLNDMAGDDSKWIYYVNDIDSSSEVLIPADVGYLGTSGSAGHTTPTRSAAADLLEFVVIKHSGFQSDGTTVSTDNLFINFTHSTAAANATGNIVLEPGDVWWGRFAGTADTACYHASNGLLSTGDVWKTAELKFDTPSEVNNIYSLQLRLGASSSVNVDFEVNDISIVYRTKNIK